MSTELSNQKVTARHLARNAYLYVRQATTLGQSTQRQYALRQRALALGWLAQHIIVLDQDFGQSGATAADRLGYQTLLTEVGLGRSGIVLTLEASRLTRNYRDWHRLIELCSLTHTLILLEEDGLYDPSQFHDRLLLDPESAMSEAQALHRSHRREESA